VGSYASLTLHICTEAEILSVAKATPKFELCTSFYCTKQDSEPSFKQHIWYKTLPAKVQSFTLCLHTAQQFF